MLSLLAKLGVVLYWLGCLLAVVLLIIAGLLLGGNPNYQGAAFVGGVSVVCWLVGRACMYVLAGR